MPCFPALFCVCLSACGPSSCVSVGNTATTWLGKRLVVAMAVSVSTVCVLSRLVLCMGLRTCLDMYSLPPSSPCLPRQHLLCAPLSTRDRERVCVEMEWCRFCCSISLLLSRPSLSARLLTIASFLPSFPPSRANTDLGHVQTSRSLLLDGGRAGLGSRQDRLGEAFRQRAPLCLARPSLLRCVRWNCQ